MPASTRVPLALVAATLVSALAFAAEAPQSQPAEARAIGPQYEAGAFYRWLWGTDYRALWTKPVRVETLDVASFGGGLTPVARVGGRQTKGLALRGADGRDYTFRAIDKDPTSVLPEELQDTWARSLVQDQIAASQPAAFLVADELMAAAGILHAPTRLVVMPDDPRLGEFRQEFAATIGQISEFPGGRTAQNPGFHGALEVLKHQDFYARLLAGSSDRPDARAFLKARLFDLMIGDWDRHRDQWRWARFEGKTLWQPIPDDRDQAFSRYEGLVVGLARPRAPFFQSYDDTYPGMKGLTWNGRDQDRRLLAGLEKQVFLEVAAELKAAISDAVIENAVRRMPAEYVESDAARLTHDLRGRRDRLAEAADRYYLHLADKVKLYLTDASEIVEVERANEHDARVRVWARGADGQPLGEPVVSRTLHDGETSEVQVYLAGGDDRVSTLGNANGIVLRVVGGSGRDVVDDAKGGGTRLSSDGGPAELVAGPGSHLDRKKYTPPPPPEKAPWIPPRDWGRDTFFSPWLAYGSDLGAFVGLAADTRAFGFRKDPYASRHSLRAGWAFGEKTFRADYRAEFRTENRSWYWGWYGYASGVETSRYYGFGNETSDGGDPQADVFKAKQNQFAFTPTLALPFGRAFTLFLGPTVKYGSNQDLDDATLLNAEQPYGFGDFGEVGATALLELDTRDGTKDPGTVVLRSYGYPRHGVHALVRGQVFPSAWDVEETFGSVKGNVAVYLSPSSVRAPTLALRAGGQKTFGRYPYFEAAYLGGGLGGFAASAGDDPVRGLPRHRYAGDSTLYGSAELRVYISRFRFILPGTWGVLGFADVGRVWLDGEDSNLWHEGYGGGLWFAWLDRGNTVSASFARSEGQNAVYVRAGFAF
jgi:hypothetical protein